VEERISGIEDKVEKLLHLDSNKEKKRTIMITTFKPLGLN
jgi:hypothetical protein